MPTVLVVDDLLADRRIAGGLLQQDESLTIVFAKNGIEALEEIELHVPDLVVTDLQMPEMNGLELVEAIKEKYPLIPTILMTAAGSETIAVEALEAGASSYVPKRRLAEDLHRTVTRVLGLSTENRSQTRVMNRLVELSFELENDLSLISLLISHLRETLRAKRLFDESDCLRISSALDEALLNSYYHGNLEVSSELREKDHNSYHELAAARVQQEPFKNRKIRVTVKYSDYEIKFIIRDEGPGFDPSSLPDPTDPKYLERPSGRGILLMKSFMDEMIFNDTGNEVTLVKRCKPIDKVKQET